MSEELETPAEAAPSIQLRTGERNVDAEKIALFSLDDRVFYVEARPRMNLGLRYLRDLKKDGETLAVAGLLTALLGEEAFDALVEYDDLTTEDMEAITAAAQKLVFGQMDEASKN